MDDRLTLIVAPYLSDALHWASEAGKDWKDIIYISGPEQLFGHPRVNIKILGYPCWWCAEDDNQLQSILDRSNA